MIKINLLTEKRGPKINVTIFLPYLLVVLVGIGLGAGWVVGSETAASWNNDLKKKETDLNAEKAKRSKRVPDRDKAKSACNKLQAEINRLQRLSGANYLQWSTTMDTIKDVVPKGKVWITNLRIDSDRRVQITAYSCNESKDKGGAAQKDMVGDNLTEGIREFIQGKPKIGSNGEVELDSEGNKVYYGGLLNNQYFSDVFLTGATKNVYEKKPVWRFEMNCRLTRDLASKSE